MSAPIKDPELLSFATNFSTRISNSPGTFNLDAGDATTLSTLLGAYSTDYNAMKQARDAGIRSKSLTSAKDTSKKFLLANLRMLYAKVQADVDVSDADKDLLGIVIRKLPVRHGAPTTAPAMDIVSVIGRTVKVRVHDAEDHERSRPEGVAGVTVLSYTGPAPAPSNPSAYKFEGNTTKDVFNVVFPDDLAPGATVFLTGFWRNSTDMAGPPCQPISVTFGAAGLGPVAQTKAA